MHQTGGKAALEVTGQNVTAYNIMENMVSVRQAYTAQRENNYRITQQDYTVTVEAIWTNVSCSIMDVLKP